MSKLLPASGYAKLEIMAVRISVLRLAMGSGLTLIMLQYSIAA
jgi:hypothetical protein